MLVAAYAGYVIVCREPSYYLPSNYGVERNSDSLVLRQSGARCALIE
jgi:hypothetical protein